MTCSALLAHAIKLSNKIRLRRATIAIVGLGYVGLPLARAIHDAGFSVIGFDADADKIGLLKRGESYLPHLGGNLVPSLSRSERFTPTNFVGRIAEADIILLCEPTPLGPQEEPDMSSVEQAADVVAKHLRPGQLVSLEATTWPSTRQALCLRIFETSGLRVGQDFFVAYSPDRENPGPKIPQTESIPKQVGGVDEISTKLAVEFYSAALDQVVLVNSTELSETASFLQNLHLAPKITSRVDNL